MKYFTNIKNLEELRAEYKKLIKKYHPDNGGSVTITQEINNEYEKLFAKLKNVSETEYSNISKSFDAETDAILRDVIYKIINFDVDIEIIGSWIWVTGNTYSFKNELKKLNFKWSSKKTAWYFHHETYIKRKHKVFSLDEIRSYYGTTKIEKEPKVQLA